MALVVVAVTFALAGGALFWQLHRSAIATVVDLAESEAGDIGTLLAKGPLPARFTSAHPGTEVQVVDTHRRVLSATADLAGRGPVSELLPAPGTRARFDRSGDFADDGDPDVAVALGVQTPQGPRVVYVLASTDTAEDAARNSLWPLVAVLFGMLLATGIVAWVLVGRALRPVERIRVQVSEMSGGDLRQRVDEPPTDDEVGRLARTMNAMLARIEASADQQARFVSDASHELRSPLAALLAQLEVARRNPDSTDWPTVAGMAIEDGFRLQRIVDDLLLLARSDEGHLVPRHEVVDLDELGLDEGERLRARERVDVDLRGVGAARVVGDPDLLRRLLRNLVDNAERHARHRVSLDIGARDGAAEVVVADDGPGIPADKREWVFERFARLDDARGRRSGGTGLGLAIVGEIARAHGGSVRVADSTVGTRMVVQLPLLADTGAPTTDGAATDAPPGDAEPTANGAVPARPAADPLEPREGLRSS